MTSGRLAAVTVVGNDRKGIVAGVTRVLYDAGCNLLDATSTILHGHFAMVLIVAPPNDLTPSQLETQLGGVAEDLSLNITARAVEDAAPEMPEPTHMVSVYGADQPGIVFKVAQHLVDGGVNITGLSSRVIGSPDRPVYALLLEVASDADLSSGIDALRERLGMDVTVHPIDSDVL